MSSEAKTQIQNQWAFDGPLAGAPPEAAWTLLVAAGVAVLTIAWLSYRKAVARPPSIYIWLLALIRLGIVSALFTCIANPVRVERSPAVLPKLAAAPASIPPPKRLAIVIDTSESMLLRDNRGQSRLDNGLRTWRRLEKAAQDHFATIEYYSLSDTLTPASSLDDAIITRRSAAGTHLIKPIAELLKSRQTQPIDTAVVITDGVDTSRISKSTLRETAIETGTRLFYIPAANRSDRPQPFVRVHEWRAPATARTGTQFSVEANFEAFSRTDRSVRYSLWRDGLRVEAGDLPLTVGSQSISRVFTLKATEAKTTELTLRLGETSDSPIVARSFTQVTEGQPLRILLLQGSADWGTHHISRALLANPLFSLTTLTTLPSGKTLARSTSAPDSAAEPSEKLTSYDCIILASPSSKNLNAQRVAMLVEYTKNGGSILFMNIDDASLHYIGQSDLRSILPLHPQSAASSTTSRTDRFPSNLNDDAPASLTEFQLTEIGRATKIFQSDTEGETQVIPRFHEHGGFMEAKPAARVLAVAPESSEPTNKRPFILLSEMKYGRGTTAILTTDSLWRWRLSLPSTASEPTLFWQQLVAGIVPVREKELPRFIETPSFAFVSKRIELRVRNTDDTVPQVFAQGPDGRTVSISNTTSHEPDGIWRFGWTPEIAGSWELAVGNGLPARTHVFVTAIDDPVGEHAQADVSISLPELARNTGGSILTNEVPPEWQMDPTPPAILDQAEKPMVGKKTYLRWNRWPVLLAILALYITEQLIRRIIGML